MSRWRESHRLENQRGPGDSRPTGLQIVQDERREGDLKGKVVLITGCSSGIGPATTAALYPTGAKIYCTARNLSKAEKALAAQGLAGKVHLLHLDLTSLRSVRDCVAALKTRESSVSILINNAGVMAVPQRELTEDGFEMQLGTNHLGHFALFAELFPLLIAGSSQAFHARVVNVSSSGHRNSGVHFDDLQLEGCYDPWLAYGQSKTANIYMASQISRLYGGRGVEGYSLNPGGIHSGLQKYSSNLAAWLRNNEAMARYMKSPEQGCATTVMAAVGRELEGRGGVYLDNCAICPPIREGWDEDTNRSKVQEAGYASWVYDQEKEEKLWELSKELIGVDKDFDKI
jgi:NAD(P)-dependent dehydrogenase (short-subunit alcohol dehydrogenase family)